MSDLKIELIRELVSARRGAELRLMAIGVSEYCNQENDRKATYPEELDRPNPKGNIASDALEHLGFTAKYGEDTESVTNDEGHIHFAYKREYEQWLVAGAPGLFLDEIQLYMERVPL